MATPTFYVMKWKWQAYSTRHLFLVVSVLVNDFFQVSLNFKAILNRAKITQNAETELILKTFLPNLYFPHTFELLCYVARVRLRNCDLNLGLGESL